MGKKSSKQLLQSLGSLWGKNKNSIWLASTVGFHRNIEKFKFPPKLEISKQQQILSLLSRQLLEDKSLGATFYPVDELSPLDKEYLYEHFLTPHSFHQAHSGEGFIVGNKGMFLATINLRDHIHFQMTDLEEELENTWNTLTRVETCIGQAVHYAYSPRFGFLTADPGMCGTGLSVAVFLHVPALLHHGDLEEFLVKHRDPSVMISGLHGQPEERLGDLIVVRNQFKLGLTEENILSTVRTFSTKLIVFENSIRSKMREEESPVIKDKVSRAYAILMHSYQIEAGEAMDALSLLKLGVDLGWVKGVNTPTLNRLFFHCRRAHLSAHFGKEFDQEELPHKRTEYIHKALGKASLTI